MDTTWAAEYRVVCITTVDTVDLAVTTGEVHSMAMGCMVRQSDTGALESVVTDIRTTTRRPDITISHTTEHSLMTGIRILKTTHRRQRIHMGL